MPLFSVSAPTTPWGDYGDILVHGMTAHLDRSDGQLKLERTGPFVPPITFPGIGDIVVTADFRSQLDRSGLTGIAYVPVLKARIVNLRWERWDRNAREPAKYPASGEPENYILGRRHSPSVAAAMPDLWELDLQDHARVVRADSPGALRRQQIALIESSWDGTDLFRAATVRHVFASERAAEALRSLVPDWVTIQLALVTP